MYTFSEKCIKRIIKYLWTNRSKTYVQGEVQDKRLKDISGSGNVPHELTFKWNGGPPIKETALRDTTDDLSPEYCSDIARYTMEGFPGKGKFKVIVASGYQAKQEGNKIRIE